jgi:hypothetical protein
MLAPEWRELRQLQRVPPAHLSGAVRAECERLADGAERSIASHTSPAALEQRLRAKLADWRGLLTRKVSEGRAVLRTLLVGPLRFTPIEEERRRGYAFEG